MGGLSTQLRHGMYIDPNKKLNSSKSRWWERVEFVWVYLDFDSDKAISDSILLIILKVYLISQPDHVQKGILLQLDH